MLAAYLGLRAIESQSAIELRSR